VRGAEKALADRRTHSLLVLGDLVAGIAEIRAGNVANAFARLDSQKSRHDGEDAVESNWIAALDGEIALAEGQYDRALASFNAAQKPAWITFGRDASTVFGMNLPSRDGPARVEIARANRSAAIQEYRRLTTVGPETRSSAVLEPRYMLALSRLLSEQGDQIGARVERERFRKLWAHADAGLPELR
jgi:hypothetical protein